MRWYENERVRERVLAVVPLHVGGRLSSVGRECKGHRRATSLLSRIPTRADLLEIHVIFDARDILMRKERPRWSKLCLYTQNSLSPSPPPSFPPSHSADTQELLDGKVICYHCGKAFSKEVTNYQVKFQSEMQIEM